MNLAENQQAALCKIDIGYESDASASFLVIRSNSNMPEYRYQMLINNRIDSFVPLNVIRGDEANSFYYNITSMISLSFFLQRRKLARNDFLKLVLSMASTVDNAATYMLPDDGFLFESDYIFLNPESLEPSLIYIPVSLNSVGDSKSLKSFISDLMMQHINVDGFDIGNLVQKILAMTNSEAFSLKGFIKLANSMLYEQNEELHELQECNVSQQCCREEDITSKPKIPVERGKSQKRSIFIFLALFAQILMGGLIYISRDFLRNAGSKPSVTYAAVAILVLAIDILIIKKLVDQGIITQDSKSQKLVKEGSAGTGRDDVLAETAAVFHKSGLTDNIPEIGDKLNMRNILDVRNKPADRGKSLEKDKPADRDRFFEKDKPADSDWSFAEDKPSVKGAAVMIDIPPARKTDLKTDSEKAAHRQEIYKTELLCHKKGTEYILKPVDGADPSENIVLNKEDFIIGRLEGQVDYILKNNAVGKLHVQITTEKEEVYVKDLNSMNGTYINNTRLDSNKEYELKANDSLRIANCEFILVCR